MLQSANCCGNERESIREFCKPSKNERTQNMISSEQSVKEIRETLEAWGEALLRKDLDEMHKGYADDCRAFDVKKSRKASKALKNYGEAVFRISTSLESNIRIWKFTQLMTWLLCISVAV